MNIVKSTFVIVFIGTPHQGSSLASWGSTIAKYVRRVNRANVKILETSSPLLRAVEEDFQQMLLKPEYRDSIRIFCFYEEVAVSGVGKIVSDDSARMKQYPNLSIHANHMDMTKFSGSTDAGYISIRGVLREWVDHLGQIGANTNPTAPSSLLKQGTSATTTNNTYHMDSQGGPQFQGGTISGNTFTWGKQ